MAEWFRPAFIRTKTPILGPSTLSADRPGGPAVEDSNESEESNISRFRATSIVSSYMTFRPSTPPVPTPDMFPNIRNPETVYHKPSRDQMAEMLKVAMMTQSSMDPVPILYNTCILHVLEAYQDMRVQLSMQEQAIEDLKVSHTKDIKDFEELASQWEMKEWDYNAELKKLEVLLSKTEGGMETVSMARSNSFIHGSRRAAETISRGLDIIKERNAARNRRDKEPTKPISASAWSVTGGRDQSTRALYTEDNNDVPTNPQLPFPQSTSADKGASHAPNASNRMPPSLRECVQKYEAHASREAEAQKHVLDRPALDLTRAQLDALEQQQTEQEFGVIFDSSTSGPESSSQSAHSRLGLGIHPHEKPLPDIPRGIRMSFSFQPGDDADILAQVVSEDRANKHTSEVHMRQRTPKESGSRSETSSNDQIYFDSAEPSRKKRVPTNPSLKIKSSGKSSHVPRNLQESDPFERGDSSSSIVTAVRDNSGRSANSSQNDTQSGWPNLECKSGSSEAVTAAKRALAISKKNVSSEGNTGSGP